MTRAEATGIAYDSSLRALLDPAASGRFFQRHRPQSAAAWCAEFSRLAYCTDRSVLMSSLDRVGFELIASFDRRGTEGMLARGPPFSVLAFRGSDDLRAWMTNLDLKPAPWRGGGRAHRGFAEALEQVWPAVDTALQGIGAPVLFTGHSLGGALATLAASLVPGAGLFTFGSPRVGDSGFRAAMAGRRGAMNRYVDNRDIVCRVPSARLGYRHVGNPWLIGPDGDVTQRSPHSPGLTALLRDALRDRSAWPTGALPRDLTDHAPINYVSALR